MASTVSQEEAEPSLGELVAYFDWTFYAQVIGLFALFLSLFSLIQFVTPAMVGNDGYYHIRLADIMRREGLRPEFPYLPLTILNPKAFYDHHMLYHVGLAMFIPGDPRKPIPDSYLFEAAKWASVVFPSGAFLAIWHLLRRQGVRWAWLWALALFAVSDAFLYRMSMVRAQSLSLLMLALGIHWMLRRRYVRLLPLGFLFVWTYNAFPLLLIAAGVVFIGTWITDRKLEWWALIFPAGGIALGLLINPYFPDDMIFLMHHIAPKLGANIAGLGNEWEPYPSWTLVENSTGMFVLIALGVFALGWNHRKMDRSTLIALGLMLVFGAMLMKSRRFVEYAPAFALIFAALAIKPLTERWSVGKDRLHLAVTAGVLLIMLIPGLGRSVLRAREAVADTRPAEYMQAGAHWLRENAPAGAMIFQTDWDDFTRLFFYHPEGIYTAGLDPTFLQLADAELYDEWVLITQGKVDQPSAAIRERFGGQYVFTDTNHEAFIERADEDTGLQEVYRDDEVVIYQVVGE